MPVLNSSNPEDLQAQLAAFLKEQKQAQDANAESVKRRKESDGELAAGGALMMPKISGRNIAKNNT